MLGFIGFKFRRSSVVSAKLRDKPNKITATKCKNGMLGIYYARAKVTGISKGSTVSTTWIESPHHSLICCGT